MHVELSETNSGKGMKVLRIKGCNLLVTVISKLPTGKNLGQELRRQKRQRPKIGQTVRLLFVGTDKNGSGPFTFLYHIEVTKMHV